MQVLALPCHGKRARLLSPPKSRVRKIDNWGECGCWSIRGPRMPSRRLSLPSQACPPGGYLLGDTWPSRSHMLQRSRADQSCAEVDKAIDNLVKSGKMFGMPPNRGKLTIAARPVRARVRDDGLGRRRQHQPLLGRGT